ncbi:hypothetical protein JCM8547_000512 [Rhodosporidiobolus lusitaniae]
MDDSWSWDGTVISLSSSFGSSPSTTPSGDRSRDPSARSLQASGELESAQGGEQDAQGAQAVLGTTPIAAVALQTPPLAAPHLSSDIESASSLTNEAAEPAHPSTPPHSHLLASFLLAEHSFSPPNSPTSTTSSFPSSRNRFPSSGASSAAPRGRGRGRGRTGSLSSTASTDGSAHESGGGGGESLASGTSSAGEDEHDHHEGLVMPSLHLGGSFVPLVRETRSDTVMSSGKRAKVLVLGKSADERRTLATLLSAEDDLLPARSASSVTGGTDMSFSFLSTRPSEHSDPGVPSAVAVTDPSQAPVKNAFELLSPVGASAKSAFVELHHTTQAFEDDVQKLASELVQPLEQLEAKLDSSYPVTSGLLHLVKQAGCGNLEAAFFLYSSPPTAAEIAFSRPLSHLIPLFPVLILPPSPTGKPQKTALLEGAVQEQLDKAGVRWVGALPSSPCPKNPSANSLYLLPYDLFSHYPPFLSSSEPGSSSSSSNGVASAESTQASSPSSEQPPVPSGPTSLTASQELPPPPTPHSPAFTATFSFRSSSAHSTSSRSPSLASRSSSHRRPSSRGHPRHSQQQYSNSLSSLYALQALVHSPDAVKKLRDERAKQFLQWREVEVAARGGQGKKEVDLRRWGETEFELSRGGRGDVDFSKRVAERRREIEQDAATFSSPAEHEEDDGDVLASDSEDEHPSSVDEDAAHSRSRGHAATRSGGTARNSFSTSSTSASMDPTTPRVSYRPLAGFSSFSAPNGSSSSGNFPYSPPSLPSTQPIFSGSDDPLASSTSSLSSTRSGASTPTTASSIFLLPATSVDPFHLPSLLHLVGLNLRLAFFAPSFGNGAPSSASSFAASEKQHVGEGERAKKLHRTSSSSSAGWGMWVGAAAVVGLAFAAGLAIGASAAEGGVGGGAESRWAQAFFSRV